MEKYPTLVTTWNYPKKKTAYRDINLNNILTCASDQTKSSGSSKSRKCNLIKVSGSDNFNLNKFGLYLRNKNNFEQVYSQSRMQLKKYNKLVAYRGSWSISDGSIGRIKSHGRTKYPLKAKWLTSDQGNVDNLACNGGFPLKWDISCYTFVAIHHKVGHLIIYDVSNYEKPFQHAVVQSTKHVMLRKYIVLKMKQRMYQKMHLRA